MNFLSDAQKFKYEGEKQLYPEADFDQMPDGKIMMHWIMRYYRSGLSSVWLFKRYITKTGKITKITRLKL